MQALDLNLASRPFRNNTPLWVVYGTTFLALALFTAWNVTTYLEHVDLVDNLQSDIRKLESDRQDLTRRDGAARAGIARHNLKVLKVRADKANEVIEWRAFSWTSLFNRMEQVKPWDVYLKEVKPIFRGDAGQTAQLAVAGPKSVPVIVQGVAKTHKAFRDLEENVIRNPYFGDARPEKTQREENREIAFTLRFTYFPDVQVNDEATVAATEGQDPPETADKSEPPAVTAALKVAQDEARPALLEAEVTEDLPRIKRRRSGAEPARAEDGDDASGADAEPRRTADDGSEEPSRVEPERPRRPRQGRPREAQRAGGKSGS